MKTRCKHTKKVPLEELVPNPRNPNTHPEGQIELLAKILSFQGWRAPIVVSKRSGFVVRGHGRLLAAQRLKLKSVPVDVQDYDDEAQEWADLVADNRIAELAEVDRSSLKDILEELDTGEIDMDLTGFDQSSLEDLMSEFFVSEEGNTDADEIPDQVEARTKAGDLWKLGDHRLLCGDATKPEDLNKLTRGEEVDLCFTSPPYALGKSVKLSGNRTKSKEGTPYRRHEDDSDSWGNLISGFWSACESTARCFVLNLQMLAGNKRNLIRFLAEQSDRLVDVAVWDKGHSAPSMAEGVMNSSFEFLLVFAGKDATRRVPFSQFRGTLSNVYSGPPQRKNDFSGDHAATMPTHLPRWALSELCGRAQTVLDPFAGTGTTLVVCNQLRRKSFHLEIDPHFCDIAINRWENFTGKKARKVKA